MDFISAQASIASAWLLRIKLEFRKWVISEFKLIIMSTKNYLDQILSILSTIKDDKEKLEKVLTFLETEIYSPLENEDNNTIQIPNKFGPLINNIAQFLEMGHICYLNPDTLELEDIPKDLNNYDEELFAEWDLQHNNWENVLTIEPLESFESFKIMEGFVFQLQDSKEKGYLEDILNRKKPFANFNHFIHNSKYREDWFSYRTKAYENHVRTIIAIHLNQEGNS